MTFFGHGSRRLLTDEQLAVQGKAGDDAAFSELARRYEPVTRGIARSRFAPGLGHTDMVQEAEVALWRADRSFDLERGIPFMALARLVIQRHVDTAVITANRGKHSPLNDGVSLNWTAKSDDDGSELLDVLPDGGAADPYELLARRHDLSVVVRIVSRELSQLERDSVVGLMNGETYAETASRIGASAKTVDNAIMRSRRKVLAALEEAA